MSTAVSPNLPYVVTLDDDLLVCTILQDILQMKSFAFSTVSELKTKISSLDPVGVFVDVNLANNECGLDFIPELKKTWPNAPIIVITSDDNEALIMKSLSLGADDFILKPLNPNEVTARLNARRNAINTRAKRNNIAFGDIVINLHHKTLTGPLGQAFLSTKEINLLAYFIKSGGVVLPKDAIKSYIWGDLKVNDNALNRKLHEIRRSLGSVTAEVELKSIYGKGVVIRLVGHDDNQILLEDMQHKLNLMNDNI